MKEGEAENSDVQLKIGERVWQPPITVDVSNFSPNVNTRLSNSLAEASSKFVVSLAVWAS